MLRLAYATKIYSRTNFACARLLHESPVLNKEETLPALNEAEEELPVATQSKIFNRSGLLEQHRNLVHDRVPYEEPQSWIHLTEKYQRKIIGRYGIDSNIDPRICFNTKNHVPDGIEEAPAVSFAEMVAKEVQAAEEKKRQIREREDQIAQKLEKLETWKAELNAKIAKKEQDALAAKLRKERLVEEVRRHFGFKVDPRDERFKEMLEQKEKEDKRKQKEAKRKAKEEKMMEKLLQKSNSSS